MKVGIGLPATIPNAAPDTIIEWATRADSSGFSSLGTIDRVVYPNYSPLIVLAAAASVTERIRLTTSVLLAPVHNAGMLAKDAASLDGLSGGRLTLGLGVGAREDDFLAAPADFHTRGKRFDEQLGMMKRIWEGEEPVEGVDAVGPSPAQSGGPELLIGAYSPQGIARVGPWADGYIAGGVANGEFAKQLFGMAEESWKEAGRSGRPRLVGGVYYALGPNAEDEMRSYLTDYYGPDGEGIVAGSPTSGDDIKQTMSELEDAGMDEVIFWPTIANLDQLDRLKDVIE